VRRALLLVLAMQRQRDPTYQFNPKQRCMKAGVTVAR
jgi:hypothetical protein